MSIDAAALSQRHSISVSVKAGGCKATLPVGDDGGMFLFTVPPFETCNTFDGPVERWGAGSPSFVHIGRSI